MPIITEKVMIKAPMEIVVFTASSIASLNFVPKFLLELESVISSKPQAVCFFLVTNPIIKGAK